jgi:hypothetical protein
LQFNLKYVIGIIVFLGVLLILSPFADPNPDGLEKAALEDHGADEGEFFDLGLLTDYGSEGSVLHRILGNDLISTIVAGLIGVLVVFGFFFTPYFILKRRSKEISS